MNENTFPVGKHEYYGELDGVQADYLVPELELKRYKSKNKVLSARHLTSHAVADFIRSLYKRGELQVQERFMVLYRDNAGNVLGYYRHTVGGTGSVTVDWRLIYAIAIKANATNLIVAHNHPSGSLRPSPSDHATTQLGVNIGAFLGIPLMDHIILSEVGHYSFSDESQLPGPQPFAKGGLNGLPNPHQRNEEVAAFANAYLGQGKSPYDLTDEERQFLQEYRGSGGLEKFGATGEGLLTEYYTPRWLAPYLWDLLKAYGYQGGSVLEPAMGAGALIDPAPDKSVVTGIEINRTAATIAELLNPGITVHHGHFEEVFLRPPTYNRLLPAGEQWLAGAPFDAIIGNPPFGNHQGYYSSYFPKLGINQVEHFFLYYGLQLLKPGGLLLYLMPPSFLRNGYAYERLKDQIGHLAHWVDAYRLPPLIKGTNITLDIVILKRKEGGVHG